MNKKQREQQRRRQAAKRRKQREVEDVTDPDEEELLDEFDERDEDDSPELYDEPDYDDGDEEDDEPVDIHAPMEFVLERTEVPVVLTDPITKRRSVYILRELDGKGRDKYLNQLGARTKSSGKSVRVTNFDGLQASLVTQAMTKCVYAPNGEPVDIPRDKEHDIEWLKENCKETKVTVDQVQAWPSRVQEGIADRAKLISGLEKESEDEAGND